MPQKLILPINNALLTASWKSQRYQEKFGLIHYGADLISATRNTLVYALGSGRVLEAGWDRVLGNSVVVQYTNAFRHTNNTARNLICRIYHLDQILTRKGAILTKDTRLGYYGSTGQLTTGPHLHIEVDTDVKYPFHTPTVIGRTTLFFGRNYGATDATMSNPLEWLHCKTSAPDGQSYAIQNTDYTRPEDRDIPKITQL